MNATIAAQAAATSSAAMLTISGLRLVLPQTEIRAIEAAAAVDAREAEPLSVGWLHHRGQRWPVYCLSHELSLLPAIPSGRRTCVLLGAGAECLGILCDDASIDRALDERHGLPPVMQVPEAPVLGLISLDDEKVACVTSAERLAAHVARLVGM